MIFRFSMHGFPYSYLPRSFHACTTNGALFVAISQYLYGCISAFNRGFSRKIKPRYQHAYAFYVVISVAT